MTKNLSNTIRIRDGLRLTKDLSNRMTIIEEEEIKVDSLIRE